MVIIYYQTDSGMQSTSLTDVNKHLLQKAVWIDLLCPTKEEEKMLEEQLNIEIPTKKEVEEIEPSSRLYIENSALYMTATMVALSDLPQMKTDVVTFILTETSLITLRYIELHAFNLFIAKLLRSRTKIYNAKSLLIDLLDAAVDRLADILEKISHKFDEISQLIFHQKENNPTTAETNYKHILQSIGANGDLGTKASESLVSFTRLISYLEQVHGSDIPKEAMTYLVIIHKDIDALREHANFLSTKFSFLLDATLGMINIEQNNTIKIFSVAAVIFLPPTLIASIYGMNFNYIPELHWHIGYPLAILMMFISAWLPYRYFKKKKWL
ncbi:magnesium transporter CorA family protein [Legionella oakridgensis]|uniref:Magnesium transport protein CorA n=2 Tax=Legionella oakridgensis TaxID=29423 RepID=W0B8Y1_9GAMM|nr:magnesium transporter CorA family protein [Legionella oakridgensis]AHE66300.1 Mg2+ and Co2+ transporter [Legionella oakridgensis ATCC 33761 = DSM 21215]ETO93935.1 Mg2+ and Co2+ transporter [Legionella oakridgensis RV-2-2007]KTD37239.1 cobalt/magnesium uptake transporter [Legionella oakridgensis]STY16191.1 metal ion transporter, MIT family [Legionella longbeachae]